VVLTIVEPPETMPVTSAAVEIATGPPTTPPAPEPPVDDPDGEVPVVVVVIVAVGEVTVTRVVPVGVAVTVLAGEAPVTTERADSIAVEPGPPTLLAAAEM